jgi:hypothetical protein
MSFFHRKFLIGGLFIYHFFANFVLYLIGKAVNFPVGAGELGYGGGVNTELGT